MNGFFIRQQLCQGNLDQETGFADPGPGKHRPESALRNIVNAHDFLEGASECEILF
jgi:hypothetical protein